MSFVSQPFLSAKVLATRIFSTAPKDKAMHESQATDGFLGGRVLFSLLGILGIVLGVVMVHLAGSALPGPPVAGAGVPMGPGAPLAGDTGSVQADDAIGGDGIPAGALTVGEDKEEAAEEDTVAGSEDDAEAAARASAGEVGEDAPEEEAEWQVRAGGEGGRGGGDGTPEGTGHAGEAKEDGGAAAEGMAPKEVQEEEAQRVVAPEEAGDGEVQGGAAPEEEAGGEAPGTPAPTGAPLPPISVKRWTKIGRAGVKGAARKECLAAKPVPKYRLSKPANTCKCGKLSCDELDFPPLSVVVPAGELEGQPAPLQAVTATLEAGRAVFAKHPTTEVLAVVPGDGTWQAGVENSRILKQKLGSLLKGYRREPLERAIVVHVIGALRDDPEAVEAALVRGANGHDVMMARPGSSARPALQNRKRLAAVGADCAGDPQRVSFLLEYFRRPRSVGAIGKALAKSFKVPTEVLVHDDSASEVEQWLKALRAGEGYLLEAGNVHEIRAYNRLVKMARGETIVLLQDDDLPPSSGSWLSRAQSLFATFPKLALLGGYSGTIQGGPYSGKFCPRPDRLRRSNRLPVPGYSGPGGGRFMFVTFTNLAPFVMRRQVLMKMGLFNQNFSCRGEAGIGFDYEIGLRMWKDGYQVGLYNHGFTFNYGDSGSTGTRANPEVYKRRMAIEIRNAVWYTKMYSPWYQNHAPRRGNGAGRFIAARRIEREKLAKVHQLVSEANTRIKAKRP